MFLSFCLTVLGIFISECSLVSLQIKALKDLGLDVTKGSVTTEGSVKQTKFFITRRSVCQSCKQTHFCLTLGLFYLCIIFASSETQSRQVVYRTQLMRHLLWSSWITGISRLEKENINIYSVWYIWLDSSVKCPSWSMLLEACIICVQVCENPWSQYCIWSQLQLFIKFLMHVMY